MEAQRIVSIRVMSVYHEVVHMPKHPQAQEHPNDFYLLDTLNNTRFTQCHPHSR